jgi:hypothetical protein
MARAVEMAMHTIEDSQRAAAKVAGFLSLLTTLTANFIEFYVRGRLNVAGDAVQTAKNITASGALFRIGIAGDLLTLASTVVLLVALFIILQPVNRSIAFIALFWSLVECSIAAVNISANYAAWVVLRGADSIQALNPEQLPALARFFISLDTAGNRIGALFFGLGSTIFCYLWFRSRYIPRVLAVWGIVSSLVPTIAPLATMMLPSWQEAYLHFRRARTGTPITIFDVLLGVWLLVKGISTPKVES